MANIWRDPIFDRTSEDITFALQKMDAWKKSHSHAADIKVLTDKIVVNDGEAQVTDTALVVNANGRAFVENETLVLELGTIYDLKGCLNLSDITRIEDNISYIASRLASYHYDVRVNSKEWARDGLPTILDIERICNNVRNLLTDFAKSSASSTVPSQMLSYRDINALEKNLYELKGLLDTMENLFIKSGTYKCGATMRLPIRR